MHRHVTPRSNALVALDCASARGAHGLVRERRVALRGAAGGADGTPVLGCAVRLEALGRAPLPARRAGELHGRATVHLLFHGLATPLLEHGADSRTGQERLGDPGTKAAACERAPWAGGPAV